MGGADTISAVRGILATAFVLGLLGLLAWLLRRGTIRLGAARGTQHVTIETAVSLGERRQLVVVAVEGRRLLLGLTPVQVSLVSELTPARSPSQFNVALDRSIAVPERES